jgi:hypothetical protein
MTEKEKEELKSEILEEVEKSLKGKVIREDVATTLKEPREYWFVKRTVDGKRQDGLMRTVIDNVTSWSMWELIRKLTCYICGKSYVRHLANEGEIANEICNILCKTVYELRVKYLNESKGGDEDET